MRDLLAADELQNARFAAAVGAEQRDAIPRPQRQRQRGKERSRAVIDRQLAQLDETVGVEGQLRELERLGLLEVFQQPLLFLDRGVPPLFDGLRARHLLLGLGPLQRRPALDVVGLCFLRALLAPLGRVRPLRLFAHRLPEAADVAFEPFVFGKLIGVLPLPVLPPAGEGPALHLDVRAVEREDVVHAAVEESAVVTDEDEALFPVQITADLRAPLDVEVVGRLVDEQEAVLSCEKQCQQQLGLLALRERPEAPLQQLPAQSQRGHLPLEPPARHLGAELLGRIAGERVRPRLRKGKVIEGQRGLDRSLVGILPHQQLQKARLAAAVAADEAQLPLAVDLKAYVFEYRIIAARIGKAEVGHLDQRHVVASPKRIMSRRKNPRLIREADVCCP